MTGLTAEQKKTLDELIGQYGISLDRSESESEIRKSIEEKSETLGIKKNNFRALAKAVWKGQQEAMRQDISDQLDLFELYGDFDKDVKRLVSTTFMVGGHVLRVTPGEEATQ